MVTTHSLSMVTPTSVYEYDIPQKKLKLLMLNYQVESGLHRWHARWQPNAVSIWAWLKAVGQAGELQGMMLRISRCQRRLKDLKQWYQLWRPRLLHRPSLLRPGRQPKFQSAAYVPQSLAE